jgi:hypothetical protein
VNADLESVEMEDNAYPGLSSRGPSHNSVLILSSDSFLVSTISAGGELAMGGTAGGDRWPPPKSSWKMGMMELRGAPLFRYSFIIKRLAWFCASCGPGKGVRVADMSSPLVTLLEM